MMKKDKKRFVAGFVLSALLLLFGNTTALASNNVVKSPQKIFLHGKSAAELQGIVFAIGVPASYEAMKNSLLIVCSPDEVIESPGMIEADVNPVVNGYGTSSKTTQAGDVIETPSGNYVINEGKTEEPVLPAWQNEWDSYPRVEMRQPPVERYSGNRYNIPYDTLMVFNEYEVERMIRTIYLYAPNNPALWKNNDPAANEPNFSIKVELAEDMIFNTFYPWRDWEIEKQVINTGGGKTFRIYAYDNYNQGRFVDTEYFIK